MTKQACASSWIKIHVHDGTFEALSYAPRPVQVTSAFADMPSSAPGLSRTSQSNYHSILNILETASDSGSDDGVATNPPSHQRRLSTAVDAPLPPHIAEPDATVNIIYTALGAATLLPWNGPPYVWSFVRNYMTCMDCSYYYRCPMVYIQNEGVPHPARIHELLERLMSGLQLRRNGPRDGDS